MGRKGAGGGNAADGAPLSVEEAVARFCDHLASEMGASAHTVRAYREDMEAYLRWAQRAGVPLRELAGCGHFCMLDDPAAFARAVAAFADDLPGARFLLRSAEIVQK